MTHMITCGVSWRFCHSITGLIAMLTAVAVAAPADARQHSRHAPGAQLRHRAAHHGIRDSGYSPPYAAIVVDANSGKILDEKNADSSRHPASLTKIMTLYLLFEQLDTGKIKLSTMMPVSEHASEQAPTKLGLRPGQSLEVEDAIRGLVTRSANDAAVVIAEAIGGDEAGFAKLMTRKARALGMSRTTYMNASGLPDDDQVTTARDQALLGRAIQERFPRYYRYFSTASFTFRGEEIRNHNHLLGHVEGVDGIKTGYTHASGFNLVTSVRRNNRHIVAVVLGGASAGARDSRMRELIEEHIAEAATRRTATMIADAGDQSPAQVSAAQAAGAAGGYALSSASSVPASPSSAAPVQTAAVTVKRHAPAGSSEPIKPIAVKTIKVKLAPVQTASLAPAAAMIPVADETGATAAPAPAPAVPAAAATAPATAPASATTPPVAQAAAASVSRPAPPTATQPATQPAVQPARPPATQPWVEANPEAVKSVAWPAVAYASEPAAPAQATPATAAPVVAPVQVAKVEPVAKTEIRTETKTEPAITPPTRGLQVRTGWIIQIGAYDTEVEAKQHLDAAQGKAKGLLHADRFTETVTKGDKTWFRARFAGFEKSQAEATCKQLRRNDIECMTVKN